MTLRPTRATILGGLLGGAATASGIALTATSGWLIVRASEQPVITPSLRSRSTSLNPASSTAISSGGSH